MLCAWKSWSNHFSITLPFNLLCVTEALLLYDCEEGGHVPSVDARVQGMLGKVVRGHSFVQWTDEWREMGVRGDPPFSLSPSLPLLPFVCLSFLHIRVRVCVCACVCVCCWPTADLCYWLTPVAAGLPTEGGGRALMNSCTSCPLRQPLHPLLN